jgi:hypothetical protein
MTLPCRSNPIRPIRSVPRFNKNPHLQVVAPRVVSRQHRVGRKRLDFGSASEIWRKSELQRLQERLGAAELRLHGQSETIRALETALSVKDTALALLRHELQV